MLLKQQVGKGVVVWKWLQHYMHILNCQTNKTRHVPLELIPPGGLFKNQLFAFETPLPSSLQDQKNTSLNYFKIFKYCKSNDKCIALTQVNKRKSNLCKNHCTLLNLQNVFGSTPPTANLQNVN